MADREGALRLKQALRVAMAEARITSWIDLALKAGVSATTLENWIAGRTHPRSLELAKVASVLRPYVSAGDLERAYAGIPPEEPPVIDLLREIAPDLHELVTILRAQADQAILEAVRASLEERRRGRGGPPEAPPGEPSDRSGE